MPSESWEEYRAQAVQSYIDIKDKTPTFQPTKDQLVWLNKYATDLELVDLGARGIDATNVS